MMISTRLTKNAMSELRSTLEPQSGPMVVTSKFSVERSNCCAYDFLQHFSTEMVAASPLIFQSFT